jgi:(R,R)-butanediol dehydrogenase/meso-butanediol dehydrogenase/diacetyl reductase
VKALRWYGRGDLRLEDVPDPTASPSEVVLEVIWCGICGSDTKEWQDGPVVITDGPNRVTGNSPPITLGHEFIGKIVECGPGVEGLVVGDRVAVEGEMRCGRCWFCQRGDYHLCQEAAYVGFNRDGGLAEYVAVPAVQAIPVPEGLSNELAALVEPCAVALHAVGRSGLAGDGALAIMGAGPVGLGAVLAARSVGAGSVVVLEPSALKREQAKRFGATETLSPLVGDAVGEARELLNGGRGADVVLECSGHPDAIGAAITLARKGGTVVTVGLHARPVMIDINAVTMSERRLLGSLGYRREFGPTFDLLGATDVDPTEMITALVPLSDAVEKGFRGLTDDRENQMKILIDPRP